MLLDYREQRVFNILINRQSQMRNVSEGCDEERNLWYNFFSGGGGLFNEPACGPLPGK